MRSIEEMYAAGDFDAIRQLLDEEEAKAEEKARAIKEAMVAEARKTLIDAAKEYTDLLGCPMDEASIVRMVKSLSSLEGLTKYGGGPVIKVKTLDDSLLDKFLRERGL